MKKSFKKSKYFSCVLNDMLSVIGLPETFLAFNLREPIEERGSILLWENLFNRVEFDCSNGKIYIFNSPTNCRQFVNMTLLQALQSEQIARNASGPVDFRTKPPRDYISEVILIFESLCKIDPAISANGGFWRNRLSESVTEARTWLDQDEDNTLVQLVVKNFPNSKDLMEDLYGNELLQ